MGFKIHVTESVKRAIVSDIHRLRDERSLYKLKVSLSGDSIVTFYVTNFDLKKLKNALDEWWEERMNEREK